LPEEFFWLIDTGWLMGGWLMGDTGWLMGDPIYLIELDSPGNEKS
jgi:hypothetical protein